jgi:hypothetical protein
MNDSDLKQYEDGPEWFRAFDWLLRVGRCYGLSMPMLNEIGRCEIGKRLVDMTDVELIEFGWRLLDVNTDRANC